MMNLDWQADALCATEQTWAFFPPHNERAAKRRAREAVAKEVCLRCPVIVDCLGWALDQPDSAWDEGFVGGRNPEELRELRKRIAA